VQRKRLVFPFSAIVNMDKLKLAILINAINPKISGLLIKGPKGSGKSTVARSLADVLPKIEVVEDCPFNCNPKDLSNMCPSCSSKYVKGERLQTREKEMAIVDLPLGATEDRVIGSLDVEKAIKHGIGALEPGILAEANQNILYVDEVNLLPDHIADDLLDVAATGWNVVEREGVSVRHPSRFIFIGTMNPEEGELRPQLLDRFPLSVTVGNITSVEDRVEVIKRNLEFEADPEKFQEKCLPMQKDLQNRIEQAREALKQITLSEDLLRSISEACLSLKVDGLRPDIVIAKAAATLAAFENRTKVTPDDVAVAAELALGHRTREGGFLEPATPQEIAQVFAASTKKVFQFEKTGETTKEDMAKRKFLKGKSVFWVKNDAEEKEEEKAQREGKLKKTIQKQKTNLMSLLGRLTGGVWGIGKRLKKNPKDAPVTDGLQVGSNKLRGETYEDKSVGVKKGPDKGVLTVSEVARHTELSKGFPLIDSFQRKIISPSRFFLKMGKVKPKKRGVFAGRHSRSITALQRGRPYGWKIPRGKPVDIHVPATVREAARKQANRTMPLETALSISLEDVREKLRSCKAPLTMVFVVDLSGSMLLNLGAVREALLKLHGDAYRGRDRVGIVALRDFGATVVQHPITNLRVVASKLQSMHVSGFTPLAAGMHKALEVLREAKKRDHATVPVMVLITDGSANIPLKRSIETGKIRQIDEALAAAREYEDVAVTDVFTVSRMLRREGVHVIAVNTNAHMYGRETYGFLVTECIASLTNGTNHTIGTLISEKEMIENMIERIREDQRVIMDEKRIG
jgi:Mg-chelatase subunit ChlI/Mg-chelatase subunit ChlD